MNCLSRVDGEGSYRDWGGHNRREDLVNGASHMFSGRCGHEAWVRCDRRLWCVGF